MLMKHLYTKHAYMHEGPGGKGVYYQTKSKIVIYFKSVLVERRSVQGLKELVYLVKNLPCLNKVYQHKDILKIYTYIINKT